MADFGNPYTETPVSLEDAEAFLPGVHFSTRAELYLAEAQALANTRAELYSGISSGELTTAELTSPYALTDIHAACYGSVWQWAGRIRERELSIGAAPEHVREALYAELDQLNWQSANIDDLAMTPEFVAMSAHHHLVKIHPFVDGNGRVTRLYADALLLSLTGDRIFDWTDDPMYFDVLRRADSSMDPSELLSLIPVKVFRD